MRVLLTSIGVLLIVTLSLIFGPTRWAQSLRIEARSVRNCHDDSGNPGMFGGDPEKCLFHCWNNYISNRPEVVIANKEPFDYTLEEFTLPEQTSRGPQGSKRENCCCYYNVPWPKNLVKKEFLHREADHWNSAAGPYQCLPIVVSMNLRQTTKDSYNELCRLLKLRRPMNMIELGKFVDAAAYLNYMSPKHPTIWRTLKKKAIRKLDEEAVEEFRTIHRSRLFDEDRQFSQYGGHTLNVSQLVEFEHTKKLMPKALKSDIVAKAVDELIISYAMVDITAAEQYVNWMNYYQLGIPDHILSGDYDKYDKSSKPLYFTLVGINCELLAQVNARLSNYLTVMKRLLSSLFEKLVFETMEEFHPQTASLKHSKDIYKTLLQINCPKRV